MTEIGAFGGAGHWLLSKVLLTLSRHSNPWNAHSATFSGFFFTVLLPLYLSSLLTLHYPLFQLLPYHCWDGTIRSRYFKKAHLVSGFEFHCLRAFKVSNLLVSAFISFLYFCTYFYICSPKCLARFALDASASGITPILTNVRFILS